MIGLLDSSAPDAGAHVKAFSLGLKEGGFTPNDNVTLEYRSAEDHYGRLPELADQLIRLNPAVVACAGIPAALVAKKATTSIPITALELVALEPDVVFAVPKRQPSLRSATQAARCPSSSSRSLILWVRAL
jgi:hypothetical protein